MSQIISNVQKLRPKRNLFRLMGPKIKNVVKMVKVAKSMLTYKSNQPIVKMRSREGGKEGRGRPRYLQATIREPLMPEVH